MSDLNKPSKSERPKLVKMRTAHEVPPGDGPAPIPLDQRHVLGEVQRTMRAEAQGAGPSSGAAERRPGRAVEMVAGLRKRAANLCEACVIAEGLRGEIEVFMEKAARLRENIARGITHLEADDAHFGEWEREGLDFEVVEELGKDLDELVGKYTVGAEAPEGAKEGASG